MSYEFMKNPFKKKRKSKRKSVDFSNSPWAGTESVEPYARYLAQRFSFYIRKPYLEDDIYSALIEQLPRLRDKYDPEKSRGGGEYRFYSLFLAMYAKAYAHNLLRNMKRSSSLPEGFDIVEEVRELKDPLKEIQSHLTADEFWFLSCYFTYNANYREICKVWCEHRTPISEVTVHRRVQDALAKVEAIWKTI